MSPRQRQKDGSLQQIRWTPTYFQTMWGKCALIRTSTGWQVSSVKLYIKLRDSGSNSRYNYIIVIISKQKKRWHAITKPNNAVSLHNLNTKSVMFFVQIQCSFISDKKVLGAQLMLRFCDIQMENIKVHVVVNA